MTMKKKSLFWLLVLQLPMVFAADTGGDIFVGAFELDKLLALGSALLAVVLCIITVLAYNRSKNKRLLFVSAAFGLFAVKGLLFASEIVFGDWGWTDIGTNVLDFAILLTFFFGILRK